MSDTTAATPTPAPISVPPLAPVQEHQTLSREYVHELREESKQWRQKAQGHETAAQQAKADAEKAKADADKAVAEARSAADARVIRAELKAAAIKAGIIDLDGLKLLDTSEVKLDDQGDVVIPDGFFDNAKRNKPWLFGSTTSQTQSPPRQEPPRKKTAKDMDDNELRAFERANGIRV
jgi:hypothetical protein